MDIEQALHALATSAAARAGDPPARSLVRRVHRRRAARATAQSVAGVGAAGAVAVGITAVLPLASVHPAASGQSPTGTADTSGPLGWPTAEPTQAPTASTELSSALPLPPSRFAGTEEVMQFWDTYQDDAAQAWDACGLTVDELRWTTSGPVELQLGATVPSGGIGTNLELSTRLTTTDGSSLTDPQTISHVVAVDPATGTVVGVPSEITGQSTVDAGTPVDGSGVVLTDCQVGTGFARLGAGTYDVYAMQRALSPTGDVWRARGGPWRVTLDGKTTARLADDGAALDAARAAAGAAEEELQAQRDAVEATLGATAGKG
ncbi:hypothetical protein AGMMS50218_14310 [Actinomycetota bacterium]|nr:hypothetical protein AGMMS50218_14310 [Actinomycetota bacterium]